MASPALDSPLFGSNPATEPNLYVRGDCPDPDGSAYGQLGDFVAARNSFHDAIAVSPKNASLCFALSMTTRMAGDTNGAVDIFSQATTIQLSDVGYLLPEQILQQTGRFAEAQDAALRPQRLSSEFTQAQRTANSLLGH